MCRHRRGHERNAAQPCWVWSVSQIGRVPAGTEAEIEIVLGSEATYVGLQQVDDE